MSLLFFLASILITDTTGFEAYVEENNPKFYQSELRKSKAYSKVLYKKDPKSTFDAEKFAQSKMPKAHASNTDALGVIRDVNFFDSKSLIPALETFFQLHPNTSFKYFLGDSGFNIICKLLNS